MATKVTQRAGILRVSGGLACSSGRRGAGAGSGVGQHLLDDFAVRCRNVATCIMDVASHYVVGEVRLQHDVLWVHMHLRKEGTDGKGSDQAAVLHWVAEADGQTQRRQREGDKEMEKDHARPRDALTQRREKMQTHRERKEQTAHSQRKHHQITLLGRQVASSVRGQDRGPGTGHSEPLPQGTQQ